MVATGRLSLNLGAGQSRIPGFINVDISSKADLSLDLGKDRLPFDNDSVDLVFSYHTLEHVTDYLFCLSEIYRTLKPGGSLLVGVPYVTLTEYHLVNPFHLHNFNEFSFDFFDPERLKGSAAEDGPISFRKVFHRFHYTPEFAHMPSPLQQWCRRHLFNVVRDIDFGLLAIKGTEGPLPPDGQSMQEEFARCLSARAPY